MRRCLRRHRAFPPGRAARVRRRPSGAGHVDDSTGHVHDSAGRDRGAVRRGLARACGGFPYGRCGGVGHAASSFTPTAGAAESELVQLQDEGARRSTSPRARTARGPSSPPTVPARSPGLCRRARDPGAARRALGRLPRPAVTRRKARPASRGACRTAPTRVPSPGVVIRPRWPAGNRSSAVPAVRLVGDPLDEGAAERGEPVLRRCARAQWRRTAGVGVVELALDVVEQGEQQSVAVAEPAEERALADARHPTRRMAGTPSSGRIGETGPL